MSELAISPTLPIFANVENNSIEGYLKNLDLTTVIVGQITGQPGLDLDVDSDNANIVITANSDSGNPPTNVIINGSSSNTAGGDVILNGGNTITGSGGAVNLCAGSVTGIGANGGPIDIKAGNPNDNGNGGAVTITSGRSGTNTGNAGNMLFTAGNGIGISSLGGNVSILAGDSSDELYGGAINLIAGNGEGTGPAMGGGGDVNIQAGIATSVSGDGGNINITAGNSGITSGIGGSVTITSGDTGTATGTPPGDIILNSGNADNNADAGDIFLNGGDQTDIFGGSGGSIILTGGTSTGSSGGNIELYSGTGSTGGDIILDSTDDIDITANDELALRSILGRILISSFTPVDIVSFQGINTSTNFFQLHKFNTSYIIENFGTGNDYININPTANNIIIGNNADINTISLQTTTSNFSFEETDLGLIVLTADNSGNTLNVYIKLSRYGNMVAMQFYNTTLAEETIVLNALDINIFSAVGVIPASYRPSNNASPGEVRILQLDSDKEIPVYVVITPGGSIALQRRPIISPNTLVPFGATTLRLVANLIGIQSTVTYSIQ